MATERKVEATTSAWLGNPEQAFYVLGEVNKEFKEEDWVGIEVYPVRHKSPLSERTVSKLPLLRRLTQAGYRFAFRDGRVSSDKLKQWSDQYRVPIKRIHLPFHYSIPTGAYNYAIHSIVKEPGTPKDRAIATMVAYMTMTAMNGVATRLAEDFGAELNSHVNIIEEAAKRGKLDKVLGKSRERTLIENDIDYPRAHWEDFQIERDPGRAIDAVVKHNLKGIIYGLDHAYRAMQSPEHRGKFDPRDDFVDFEYPFNTYLKNIHLSGSRGDHGLVQPDDAEFWSFMEFARDRISDDVVFCLDLDPVSMDKMKPDQQVDYMKDTVKRLREY